MRKSLMRPRGRGGFTLVELMIVIAIIGLLVGILIVALGPLMSKGGEMTTRNEINQMGIALETFKSQFGFYPPSQLLLCENQNDYNAAGVTNNFPAALIQDSQYYLLKMFPRMSAPNNTGPWNSPTTFVDWNQNGSRDVPVLLTGDACLVFFLGGIQTSPGGVRTCNGFRTTPVGAVQDPLNANRFDPLPPPTTTAYGPYYEFRSDRLVTFSNSIVVSIVTPPIGPLGTGNGYFSYLDGYKQTAPDGTPAVYAYFSSGRTRNNYNRYVLPGYLYSDCRFLASFDQTTPTVPAKGLLPYASVQSTSGNNYQNPNTYQILSPGKDGVFGLGSQFAVPGSGAPPAIFNQHGYPWTPTIADQFPPPIPGGSKAGWGDGRDDITNFNSTLLGKL